MYELKRGIDGNHISEVAEKIIELAKEKRDTVYVDFNDILLWGTRHMTPEDVISIFDFGMNLSSKRYSESDECKQYELEIEKKRRIFNKELKKEIKMFELKVPEEKYKEWKDKNSDGYSKYCFTCAEKWAELMEDEIKKGNELTEDIIKKCSHNPITDNSSGAQMGFAKSILKKCWKYGDKL